MALETGSSPLAVWSNTSLKLIGQPVAVAGIAVGYVVKERRLFIVGVAPSNGELLWEQRASPSRLTPGVPVLPNAIAGSVAYFRPEPESAQQLASLIVADPRSGHDIARYGPAWFSSWPNSCAEEGAICFISATEADQTGRHRRIRVSDGEILDRDKGVVAARFLDDGLLDFGERGPENVGVVRQGEVAWRVPLGNAFPSDFSSDNGWSWRLSPDGRLYVGSVNGPFTTLPDSTISVDLERQFGSAGLSAADGAVLWRDAGSSFHCNGSFLPSHDPSNPDALLPVRCRFKGSVYYRDRLVARVDGVEGSLEGFDLASGATTWSLPVGSASGLMFGNERPAVAGEARILLQAEHGPIVVDLRDGHWEAANLGNSYWCLERTYFDSEEPWEDVAGKLSNRRRGGDLAYVCNARARAEFGTPSLAATRAVGTRVGDHVILATPQGLTGFKVR